MPILENKLFGNLMRQKKSNKETMQSGDAAISSLYHEMGQQRGARRRSTLTDAGVLADHGEQIDYVLVYQRNVKGPLNGSTMERKSNMRRSFLDNLKSSGLSVTRVYERNGAVYILLYTPFWKLLEIAEKVKLKLPIEVNELGVRRHFADLWSNKSKKLTTDEMTTPSQTTRYFTAPYTSALHEKFERFFNKTNPDASLSLRNRCLLTYEILSRTSFSKPDPQTDGNGSTNTSNNNEDDDNISNERIGIDRLLANGTFQAAFPLHEHYEQNMNGNNEIKTIRQMLWNNWARPKKIFTSQPIELINEYFGEKLAFYFSWLDFYTKSLIVPAILGLLVFLYGCIAVAYDVPTSEICNINEMGNVTMCPLCDEKYCKEWKLEENCFYAKMTFLVDNPASVLFAFVMTVWTVLFIDFWKRKQSHLQFEWDTMDFENNYESTRPDFEQNVKKYQKKKTVTDHEEPYIPLTQRILKYGISASAIFLMLCLVITFIFSVIVYQVVLKTVLSQSDETRPYSSTIISVTSAMLNLVTIVILGKFYSWLAIRLTDLECQRTDSEYENSLTVKMYLFQFVNFYGSVFYVAFFKGRNFSSKLGNFDLQEQCNPSGCMTELFTQLAIIMVGKQILNNLQEIILPIIYNKINNYMNRRNSVSVQNTITPISSQWAKDYGLIKWTNLTLFDEYLEMIIQYGFITLFVVAFPLGPLFSFLNNILEIRIDAFKTLTQLRRPLPRKTKDIGIWMPIINAVSKIGILTNAFIIAFTSDFVPRAVYYFSNGRSLKGYVKFNLSAKNMTDFGVKAPKTEICYYMDFREPHDSPNNKYGYTIDYFIVLCARLAFVVAFEHLVIFLVGTLHWIIPNTPKEVKDQVERENLLKQRAMWQINTNSSFTRNIPIAQNGSDMFFDENLEFDFIPSDEEKASENENSETQKV